MLCEALVRGGFDLLKPMGAFYAFPRCPDPDDVAFCRRLREEGIIAVPGSGFGRSGHMRLSYSVDRDTITRAAARLEGLRQH